MLCHESGERIGNETVPRHVRLEPPALVLVSSEALGRPLFQNHRTHPKFRTVSLSAMCVSCAANQGVGVKRPCPHSVGDGSNLGPSRALRRPVPGVGRRASDEEVLLGEP